jgi:hypothetical protein
MTPSERLAYWLKHAFGPDVAAANHEDPMTDDDWQSMADSALIAAAPPAAEPEGLDVDRLAQAMFVLGYYVEQFKIAPPPEYEQHLAAVSASIAAEYDAKP